MISIARASSEVSSHTTVTRKVEVISLCDVQKGVITKTVPNAEDGSFASDLGALLESGKRADLTLVVGASQLPAHSFVLATRSPVFAGMLCSKMKEAHICQIEMTDIQEDVLRQLLWFMYTDTAPQLESMAADLLVAADKYDLPLLKKKCEEKMAQDLSVDNLADTAGLAVLHSCAGLQSAVVNFIAKHPEVMTSVGWINLLLGNPEAARQICNQVAKETPKLRISSVEQTPDLVISLTEAAKYGRVDELRRLLAAGAPVDTRDGSGFTILHIAVMKAGKELVAGFGRLPSAQDVCLDTVKCLLSAGANVNAEDSSLQTPLHAAAYRGDVKIVWALLLASAKVDAQDRWGKTPLHWAAAASNAEAVRTLLLAGAKRDINDYKSCTPMDIASKSIKELFKAYS